MKVKGQTSTAETRDQLLERRRKPGALTSSGPQKDQVVFGLDAFKHILAKHSVRNARYGTPYALASLNILEWLEVAKTFGEPASKQLLRSTQDAILKCIRLSDRLCPYAPGKFILLLPDCSQKMAKQILERICLVVATCKTQYHKTTLRASLSYKLCGISVEPANLEAMLASIGIEVVSAAREDNPAHQNMADDLKESWLSRYANLQTCHWLGTSDSPAFAQMKACDKWASEKEVLLVEVHPEESGIKSSQSGYQTIAGYLNLLQQIEHPGLLRLSDFYLVPDSPLQLVFEFPPGQRWDKFLAKPEFGRRDPAMQMINWAEQICSCLIVLQKHFPHLLSLKLDSQSFSLDENLDLVFCDYFWHCLEIGKPESDPALAVQSFGQLMSQIVNHVCPPDAHVCPPDANDDVRKFFHILSQGSGSPASAPKELNNFYKIRAKLLQMAGAHA